MTQHRAHQRGSPNLLSKVSGGGSFKAGNRGVSGMASFGAGGAGTGGSGSGVSSGPRGLSAAARSARRAVELAASSIHESYADSNIDAINAKIELNRDDGNGIRGSGSRREALSEKSDGSDSSSVGPSRSTISPQP